MTIPPITDELGQYWKQPALSDITLYKEKAIMTQRVFDKLKEYSASYPSGTYEGKMWKCQTCVKVDNVMQLSGKWFLCWYEKSTKPGKIDIRSVSIELT